jgi:UDP-N-acetylglucosamine 2-epimerase (non-hydrolysing)
VTGPHVAHVVGARPNFMKAAPVIRALAGLGVAQRLIHTGQHYDFELSEVFFRELGLPEPDTNLGVGAGSHAEQTARAMIALEQVLLQDRPALLIVYGDVNSTLSGALVGAKLRIPVAHVEAGLRSFDDSMPEEINRKVTDLLSEILFATSPEAVDNLRAMGVPDSRIHFVGNPMIDSLLACLPACDPARVADALQIGRPYVVVTLHRPGNVDDPRRAERLVGMLNELADDVDVVFPVHPRGRQGLVDAGLRPTSRLMVIPPVGYLDFVALMRGARAVVTDSGGIQEETTVLGIPCFTVRPNTERPITITLGTNRLAEPETVPGAVRELLEEPWTAPLSLPPLWDGEAGPRIARVIAAWLASNGEASEGANAARAHMEHAS